MFGKRTTVPSTITDRQAGDLERRAQKVNASWFSDKAIAQRKASSAQQGKAEQS